MVKQHNSKTEPDAWLKLAVSVYSKGELKHILTTEKTLTDEERRVIELELKKRKN